MRTRLFSTGLLALLAVTVARAEEARLAEFDPFNYVAGTQTIGAAYQFTNEPRLVETARGIREMGSNVLKFSLAPEKGSTLAPPARDLADLAERDPAIRTVLAMPFAHYLLWAYPLATEGARRFQAESLGAEYTEIYALARYLLQAFAGTGKTFYLGNWEGDWHLLHSDPARQPTPEEVRAMIDWVNTRQQAVDDAQRDTPHAGVEVHFYLEVNRVLDAMAGKVRLANAVLPSTPVEFVSYSSYDALDGPPEKLTRALDYLEAQLPARPELAVKRVFIGEYGFPAVRFSPEEQAARTATVLRTSLAWGCRFALYWEFYNNEAEASGKQIGYWLIDAQGVRQPAYELHRRFLAQGRQWVADFAARAHRGPSEEEFRTAAQDWLSETAIKR